MPSHHQIARMPYTAEQLFALVADVASYPEFLPWCKAARILEQNEESMKAQLAVQFNAFRSAYTSEVKLSPPTDSRAGRIDVRLLEGPFKYLTNYWEFVEIPEGGTQITFDLQFAFQSRALELAATGVFQKAVAKMVSAFEARAKALYGPV